MNSLEYAKAGAQTVMDKFKPEELPPNHRFHYHQGIFLTGVERLYKLTGDTKYRDYIKQWVDFNIDENGNAPRCMIIEFDDLQPAVLLFGLYAETGDERYRIMLERVHGVIEKWPVNAYGGVWHKYQNKNQMWLDSMYMMGVITAMCANFFDNKYLFNKIHTQMVLMREHMTNPETGLLYHMWDDSKEVGFVDQQTGCIQVHWGRAMGWYVAALAQILDLMPEDHPYRQDFIDTEIKYLTAVKKYQDHNTGLWYQVLDRTEDQRNWFETSCTSLFTYAAVKLRNTGLIGDAFDGMIQAGYKGVLSKTDLKGKTLEVTGVCVGTGVHYLDYYLERPTVTNDLHGMGAFLLMCTEVYKAFGSEAM